MILHDDSCESLDKNNCPNQESKESGYRDDQYNHLNGLGSSIIIFNKNNNNNNNNLNLNDSDSDEHLETVQMNSKNQINPDMIFNVLQVEEVEEKEKYFHGSLNDGDLHDSFRQKISIKNLMNQQFDPIIVHCNPINNTVNDDDDNNNNQEIGGSDQKQPNLISVFDKSQSINVMMMLERGPNQLAYNQCDACCKTTTATTTTTTTTMMMMMMVIMTKFQSIFHWKTVININTDHNYKTNLDNHDDNLNIINYENDNNNNHRERFVAKRKQKQNCCHYSNDDCSNCSKTIKRATTTTTAQSSNLKNVLCWTLLFLLLSSLDSSHLNSYVTAISTPSYQLKQQRNFQSSHHLRSLPVSAYPQSSSSSSLISPKANIYHLHDRLYPFERANQLKQQMDQIDPSCPNCRLKLNRTQAENMKLYAIKQQILSKLNLEFRPNITTDNTGVAKEEALEIIRKAKLDSMFNPQNPSSHFSSDRKRSRHRRHRRRDSGSDQQTIQKLIQWQTNNGNQLMDDVDSNNDDQDDINDGPDSDDPFNNDEYFGKTSEIIMFAEPKPNLNGHVLVKVMAPENFYKLNVSKAILWLRMLLNRRKLKQFSDEQRMQLLKQNVKIYVFKVANSSSSMAMDGSSRSIKLLQQRPIVPRSFGFRNNSSAGTILEGEYDQQPLSKSNPRLSFQLLAIHKLSKLRHGWIKLNLTTAIHEWFDQAILQRQKTLLANQPPNGQQEQEPQFNRSKSSGNRFYLNSDQPSPSAHRELTLLIDCVGCNDLLDIDLGYNHTVTTTTTDSARTKPRPTTAQRRITNFNNHHHHHLNKQASSPSSTSSKKSLSKAPKTKRHQRRFRPFMVLNTEIRRKRRQRRHAYNCEDGIRQCCKQSLYVNFEELGWNDWIIYPRGYQANYCMGECVQMRTPDMLAYFHSHVLEEYRIKNPYASIAPCCAPTKLSSISLIYFDQNRHIIKADLPKMVVNECGCT